jgi:hypothetical protein
MLQGLLEAFLRFVETAQNRLEALRKQAAEDTLGKSMSEMSLPLVVQELETQQEFIRLVLETRSAFLGDHHNKSTENDWHGAVHNFFCRSGYFHGLIDGTSLNADESFSHYCTAFNQPEIQINYLALLESVSFAQSSIRFETFQIKRFSLKELETILQNRVNRVFYPWAAIASDSLKLLSQYWFIQVTESTVPSQIGHFYLPASSYDTLLSSGYAERDYTQFPKQIESALRQLCLFDWAGCDKEQSTRDVMSRKEDWRDAWLKFGVPLVLEVNNDLIDWPERVPIIPELATEPFVDAQTGEELGPVPQINVYLVQSETQHFVSFIERIGSMIRSLEKDCSSWGFLEIALGYFTKAFFSPPNLEQLLWHIVVLEALLGEGPEGITERLARRIGLILGKDENERKRISKMFRTLYDVRSTLVHGKPRSTADVTAIIDACRFSRLAIIWFLHYLSNIQSEIAKSKVGEVPNRQELLMFIDIEGDTRTRLHWLMDRIPSKFPYIAGWLE